MQTYLSTAEIAEKWGITQRRVKMLCAQNRIGGVIRVGKVWAIPADAKKPNDARRRKDNP